MNYPSQIRQVWIGTAIRAGLLLLLMFLFLIPSFVETNYSTTIYPVTSQVQRLFSGSLPINVGDLLYILMIVYILIIGYDVMMARRRKELKMQYFWLETAYNIRKLVTFVLLFYILWGLNYARIGVPAILPVKNEVYTAEQLQNLVDYNVSEANRLRQEFPTDSLKQTTHIFQLVSDAYMEASLTNDRMIYDNPAIKKSWFGGIVTKMGITGYYNPFSGEAVVNPRSPSAAIPFVAAHEVAHQLGFASEDEANFVGYLTCINSGNAILAYSAHLNMLMYSAGELAQTDSVAARKAMNALSPNVEEDLKEFKIFHLASKGFFNNATDIMYGGFLKMNAQHSGLNSYRECVALAINLHKHLSSSGLARQNKSRLNEKKKGKKKKQINTLPASTQAPVVKEEAPVPASSL